MAWDESYDVIVMGSGMAGVAGALAGAARSFKTVLIEKAPLLGGGTAYSNGTIWIGDNGLAKRAGIADSRAETIDYIKFLAAGYEADANLLTFVDRADEALEHFAKLGVGFKLIRKLPDHYFGHAPGAKAEGRMIEVGPIEGADLGEWRDKIYVSPYLPSGITFEEMISMGGPGNRRNWDTKLLETRKQADARTLGAGLIAHFVKVLAEHKVPILLSTSCDKLVVENGRVTGMIVSKDGKERRLEARKGIIIAAGGYESNARMVREYEGLEAEDWESMFQPTLHGDGLVMAAEIGGSVHTIPINMNAFLGFRVPNATPSYHPAAVGTTAYPHTIVVNRYGERFADESYFQAMVAATRHFDVWRHGYPNMPCYVIFDQNYADKYPLVGKPAGSPVPDWISRADTVEELGKKLGVDAAALAATVESFNTHARNGEDPKFNRGTAAWSRFFTGDLTNKPNPNLGPVDRAPFYGVRLVRSGGASAGLMTDPIGRVMHVRGRPIPGLYASGNAATCTDFGAGYQAGESLARGLMTSYLAVEDMAGA